MDQKTATRIEMNEKPSPKVLLIYPKAAVDYDTAHCLPLGLSYIAAVLEKKGITTHITDLNVEKDTLMKKLNKIDIVGIFTLTPNIHNAWKLAKRIKKINKNILIVFGGPHASSLPEESLKRDEVDLVVRGEGEKTMFELVRSWPEKKFASIKGLSWKTNLKIIHNKARPLIKNLDALPFPAWHLFKLERYGPSRPTWIDKSKIVPGSMITSRGCPFRCIFCFKEIHGYSYRYRSPENVIAELKLLKKKYGVNFVEFQDDNFNFYPKRAIEICRLMIKEKLNINWSIPNGISRVDQVTEKFLRIARQAGCVDIWFAVESGSQRVLNKIIGKKISLQQIEKAVKLAKKVGFEVGGFVCFGNPGETKDDMQKTIEFVCRLPLDRCQFTIVTPFPGSRLFTKMEKQKKLLTHNWDDYGPFEKKVYINDEVTRPEIVKEMYRLAFRQFYLRPSFVLKTMVKRSTYKNLKLIINQLWRFVR